MEFIPRFFKSKFDAGVKAERTMLSTFHEIKLSSGAVIIDCPRASVLTTYEKMQVLSEGHLRVTYNKDRKILIWEFSATAQEELYTRQVATEGIPALTHDPYGMPPGLSTVTKIANTVNSLDLYISDIARSYHQSGHLLSRITLNRIDDVPCSQKMLFGNDPVVSNYLRGTMSGATSHRQAPWSNGMADGARGNTDRTGQTQLPEQAERFTGATEGNLDAGRLPTNAQGKNEEEQLANANAEAPPQNNAWAEEEKKKDNGPSHSAAESALTSSPPLGATTAQSPPENGEKVGTAQSSPSSVSAQAIGKRKPNRGGEGRSRKKRSVEKKS